MTADIHLKVHPELRKLAEKEAGENETFSDVIARVLARHYDRPDLALVPRKKLGRPRRETVSA